MQQVGCYKIIFSSSATVYKPAKTVEDLPFVEGSYNFKRIVSKMNFKVNQQAIAAVHMLDRNYLLKRFYLTQLLLTKSSVVFLYVILTQ